MSTNTLATYANGEIIDASHPNEITLALKGEFVGRNANGIPTPGQSLGTLALPWGNMYATGLILNGLAVDTSQITSLPNRVVSGATRPFSSFGDFIRANGAALEFDILGDTTELVMSINNTATTVDSDLNKTGITPAPSTNNTALVNDASVTSDLYVGEDNRDIIIDTVGSEISGKVGQLIALRTATGEIFRALVKDATTLTDVFRGFYFDETGTPIKRGNLSNNDVLTLMQIGWVFVEDNGATVDVTYRTPVYSFDSPTSPQTGDYWFDISNQVWKRYSGVSFEVINRILIGEVVSDDTNTIASRCSDFSNQFREQNNLELEVFSGEIIQTKSTEFRVNVYGTEIIVDGTKTDWNITTDLETGVIEANDTYYYLYISDQGERIISDQRPHDRKDLKGKYHPYESWRFVGECFNNGSGDLVSALDEASPILMRYNSSSGQTVTASSKFAFENKDEDNSSGYDNTTGDFVFRRSGKYTAYMQCRPSSATSTEWAFSLAGNFVASGKLGTETATVPVAITFEAKFGDVLFSINGLAASRTLNSNGIYNYITIVEEK